MSTKFSIDTGSNYILLINGISVEFTGTDNGQWLSSPSSLDTMSIGSLQQSTIAYYDTTFKHLMIRSTPLSDAESLTYANYLIQKHSL